LSGPGTRWIEPQPVEVSPQVWTACGEHALLAAALSRRGVRTAEQARAFLDPDRYRAAPAADLPDLERAVERIEKSLHTQAS
jgi:single-stranded-DNA-specific exonuclease